MSLPCREFLGAQFLIGVKDDFCAWLVPKEYPNRYRGYEHCDNYAEVRVSGYCRTHEQPTDAESLYACAEHRSAIVAFIHCYFETHKTERKLQAGSGPLRKRARRPLA